MLFQIDDPVVYPSCGIGRIVALVTKSFFEAEARLYYEVAIEKSTVWVPVDAGSASGLRSLTPKSDLARYRGVLRSRPVTLTADPHKRRQDLISRLKAGSFQNLCEMVRDLTAQSWRKALGEADKLSLRKARDGLCHEWAVAEGVTVFQAMEEIDALLQEARQAGSAAG
jgi:RNA polymerase-interacting CarD/CdnL/TRCF family regulator